MCSLVAHDILQLDYKYDEISIGDRAIPDNATTKTSLIIMILDVYHLAFYLQYVP